MGIKNVEMYICSFSELNKPFLDNINAIKDYYGVTISSVHPFTSPMEGLTFFSAYTRRFYDGIDQYKKFAEVCVSLGADILVFHGSMNFVPIEDNRYFELFDILSQSILNEGVYLCQENVSTCQSCSPKFIFKMRKTLPNTKFVLDIKQCIRGSINPYRMLRSMDTNLYHLHISDNNKKHSCMPIGDGNFDLKHFVDICCEKNKNISIILELYRENFKEEGVLYENYINLLKFTR